MGADLPDPRTMTATVARTLDEAIREFDWAALPPGVRPIRYRVPSGELAGVAAGDERAPRILLVPGSTGSKEDFAFMAPLLVRAGYRVEGFDLAGQYESSDAGPERLVPPRPRYDYDLFLGDLLAVIRAGRTPVHLLGYSFAGTLAQLVTTMHPELIASLTLLSTPPVSGQVFRRMRGYGGLAALLSRFTGARVAGGLMLWGIRTNKNHVGERRYRFVMDRLIRTRRSSVDDISRLMRRTPDVAEELRAVPIPKLVAFGSHDLWAPRHHRALAARIGAEAVEYETGHSPCETTPHQLVRDMLRVIERR
ncbi:MAG: alpha/beta fold hydrolase [Microbacteriaceae bacterium]|nr:alpha/beta fold hydrolase [Microbacteriaceae bacterium]